MELGVGEALVSLLDEDGVPGIVQRTSIICPQSLMAPADAATRSAAMAADGMGKYDQSVDNDSAFELLQEMRAEEEEKAQLAAEREQLEKERAAFEKEKAKQEEAARKKAEKELERQMLAREKAAEKRKAQIERQLINAGASLLKKGLERGLLNTLSGTSKRRSR